VCDVTLKYERTSLELLTYEVVIQDAESKLHLIAMIL